MVQFILHHNVDENKTNTIVKKETQENKNEENTPKCIENIK